MLVHQRSDAGYDFGTLDKAGLIKAILMERRIEFLAEGFRANDVLRRGDPLNSYGAGAVILSGGLGVANNIYAAGRLGFSNSTNISVAYQYYNASNNSIDTVFG